MPALDLVVVAEHAVVAGSDGADGAHTVGVRDGRIVLVEPGPVDVDADRRVVLAEDEVLLPGLVDTHVHLQDPGNTEWETFEHATRAAAAGGITTLVDMPLDSVPVTVSVDALEVKRRRARGRNFVDLGFWAGVTPDNVDELPRLHAAGVMGFKCFLANTGLPEFPPVTAAQMRRAMEVLAPLDALLVVHAEDDAEIEKSPEVSTTSYAEYLASRPKDIENVAIQAVIDAAEATGARAHILHLSSADGIGLVTAARQRGVQVSAETCPHYLSLAAEKIPDGATQFKIAPPVREASNGDALWQGLADGAITSVVSDHSPCTPEMKALATGDFAEAFGGASSLQVALPVVWTAARERGFTLTDVVRWMATGPAELIRAPRKGRIAVGVDADLCVLRPDAEFVVDPQRLHHKQPLTPYAGWRLHGVVTQTYLAGIPVDAHAHGRLLRRGDA